MVEAQADPAPLSAEPEGRHMPKSVIHPGSQAFAGRWNVEAAPGINRRAYQYTHVSQANVTKNLGINKLHAELS